MGKFAVLPSEHSIGKEKIGEMVVEVYKGGAFSITNSDYSDMELADLGKSLLESMPKEMDLDLDDVTFSIVFRSTIVDEDYRFVFNKYRTHMELDFSSLGKGLTKMKALVLVSTLIMPMVRKNPDIIEKIGSINVRAEKEGMLDEITKAINHHEHEEQEQEQENEPKTTNKHYH